MYLDVLEEDVRPQRLSCLAWLGHPGGDVHPTVVIKGGRVLFKLLPEAGEEVRHQNAAELLRGAYRYLKAEAKSSVKRRRVTFQPNLPFKMKADRKLIA
jgi:hypothetical protein